MKSQFIQEKIASAESIGKRVNVCADLFEQLEKEKKPGSALKQIVQIAEDTIVTKRTNLLMSRKQKAMQK